MTAINSIQLPFGRTFLEVAIPSAVKAVVIRKRKEHAASDPVAAVHEALAHPIASQSLQALARGRRSACILICDITRPVPNHLFLRPILTELLAAGIAPGSICVLVATGLHRPNEGDELRELIGDPWVLETVRVENHFARNDADHTDLGVTPTRGTPVKIDRRFVNADLRIVTGLVEPHFMAGYSGGRKVIAPGIAHADTIRTFHSARFLEVPEARVCNLQGNPLHEEQLEIIKMIGEIYSLNTVIGEQRELLYVNFGEVSASHAAAIAFAQQGCVVDVDRKFQTVVTSAAGFPLDSTYYQTVKAMVSPLDILAPGGTLILASSCSEGIGSPEFRAAQLALRTNGPEAFLQGLLAKQFAAIDEWQTEMQLKATRVAKVQLYAPGLSPADASLTGVEVIASIEQAITQSVQRTGDPAVAFIPEGPYLIPRFAPAR